MARDRFTRFLPTQSLKNIDRRTCCNEQHVRIARSMIYSDAFKSLNKNAIILYIIIRLKFHKEEEDNKDFAFSKSLGVKVLTLSNNSYNTIRRSLKELVKKGFLDQTLFSQGGGKMNKIPNRYKFSTRWKYYKKEFQKNKTI